MLCYKRYPTKDDYDNVTCTTVQKYPFMKAPVGSPTVSYHYSTFSPYKIQGMRGGYGLGRTYGHIKAYLHHPHFHNKGICTDGLQGQHIYLMYPGENNEYYKVYFMGELTCIRKKLY